MNLLMKSFSLPLLEHAPSGGPYPIPTASAHFVNGRALKGPFPAEADAALFGMGCFWGAERKFWSLPGVHVTAVGFAGGLTPNPTCKEVTSGLTGHNEVVLVIYDPKIISYLSLLKVFWEGHDPTRVVPQGDRIGTERSAIYASTPGQLAAARASKSAYEKALKTKGLGPISTEVVEAPEFYYAEESHQQYLARNPGHRCDDGGTGVACEVGHRVAA